MSTSKFSVCKDKTGHLLCGEAFLEVVFDTFAAFFDSLLFVNGLDIESHLSYCKNKFRLPFLSLFIFSLVALQNAFASCVSISILNSLTLSLCL